MYFVQAEGGGYVLKSLPSECPFCHRTIEAKVLMGYSNNDNLDVFMCCPSISCKASFIGTYVKPHYKEGYCELRSVTIGKFKGRSFSKDINDISPSFSLIYNQAFIAEQEGLTQICGMGYRKAFEFLIKDYLLTLYPEHEKAIKKELLGNSIGSRVANDNIKAAAKRATWLGNDETHYERRWIDKDLNDLKKLIDLTIHWIELEILSKSLEVDMPEPSTHKSK